MTSATTQPVDGMTDPYDGGIDREALRAMVASTLGTSDWLVVDQSRIDRFADVTDDDQFIHTDPAAAARTPFGGTIAHGFLLLSLLSAMAATALPRIAGTTMEINYGFNRVRFLKPVSSGRRVRGSFALKDLTERAAGQWQLTLDVAVEIEGETVPALAAEWLVVFIT